MIQSRKSYPCDVSDDEWALVAPDLTLLPEDCPQRSHALREVFNGLRYVIKTGAPWRWMPNDLPPWEIVYQQARRWLQAGCFEALAEDLRCLLRLAAGRSEPPTAAIIDSRGLRSTPESGGRAAYDGAKRKKGSKLHLAVDTLGHLLALHVTPANADGRGEVARMARDNHSTLFETGSWYRAWKPAQDASRSFPCRSATIAGEDKRHVVGRHLDCLAESKPGCLS